MLDEPAEEVVLIDVLVKQLKLDLLPGELRQNDLYHSVKYKKNVSADHFRRDQSKLLEPQTNLIELVPDRVEVFFDGVAAVGDASHPDLDIGVALPLHHAPHEVVLRYQVLGFHQVDAQHPLLVREGRCESFESLCNSLSRAADLYFVLFNLSCKLWVGRGLLWSSWSRFSRAAGSQAQIWCQSTRAHLGSWARGPRRRCCGSGIITEPQDLYIYIFKSGNKRKKKQKCVILVYLSRQFLACPFKKYTEPKK